MEPVEFKEFMMHGVPCPMPHELGVQLFSVNIE